MCEIRLARLIFFFVGGDFDTHLVYTAKMGKESRDYYEYKYIIYVQGANIIPPCQKRASKFQKYGLVGKQC